MFNKNHKKKSNKKHSETIKRMYREGNIYHMGQKPHKDEVTRKRARLSAQMKNRYGITIEQYELMFNNQKGKCAICKKEIKVLCIDHNHTTKKVRGLLCKSCNALLGLSNESEIILKETINYIKQNEQNKRIRTTNKKITGGKK